MRGSARLESGKEGGCDGMKVESKHGEAWISPNWMLLSFGDAGQLATSLSNHLGEARPKRVVKR